MAPSEKAQVFLTVTPVLRRQQLVSECCPAGLLARCEKIPNDCFTNTKSSKRKRWLGIPKINVLGRETKAGGNHLPSTTR